MSLHKQQFNPGDLVKVTIQWFWDGTEDIDYGLVLQVRKDRFYGYCCKVLWLNNNTGLCYSEEDDHTTFEIQQNLTLVQKAKANSN